MPQFFVRIELPEPPKADYDELHEKMEAKHYYRTVDTTNGSRRLPHATYTCSADGWTKDQVLEEAFAIAQQVHTKPRVIVIRRR